MQKTHLSGMPGWIVRFMLALSLIAWALYGVTILWERENRKILIAEKGSMYALDAEYGGEVPPRAACRRMDRSRT